MHLIQKRFMEKYLCWFAHGIPYIPYETMVEKMVGSISSSSNVYVVIDDKRNHYRSMIMDVIGMNHSYAGECSIIDE